LQQCPPFGSDRRRGRGSKRTTSIKVADSREIVRRRKTTALRVREEGRSAGEESTGRERNGQGRGSERLNHDRRSGRSMDPQEFEPYAIKERITKRPNQI
jgi:hypothetical protein